MDFEETGYQPPDVCGLCHHPRVNGICRVCARPLPPSPEVYASSASRIGPRPLVDRDSIGFASQLRRALLPVLDRWLDPANAYRLLAAEKIAGARDARLSITAGGIPRHPTAFMREGLAERFMEQAGRRGVPDWVFRRMPAKK